MKFLWCFVLKSSLKRFRYYPRHTCIHQHLLSYSTEHATWIHISNCHGRSIYNRFLYVPLAMFPVMLVAGFYIIFTMITAGWAAEWTISDRNLAPPSDLPCSVVLPPRYLPHWRDILWQEGGVFLCQDLWSLERGPSLERDSWRWTTV